MSDIVHEILPVIPRHVHLIYKYKYRNLISLKQFPQRLRVALHSVHAIDDQNCIIEDLKSPFHLRSEIHMSWSVKQCYMHITKVKLRLLGKYRDPPVLFLTVHI